jgi:group I intron endonuclease
MIYYTVYKVTNKINGKIYIGSHKTKNLNDNYFGSEKYLIRALQKYGLESFTKEILFVFDNPEDMYAKEAEIVDENFIAEENTYNLKRGGFGGFDYVNDVGKFSNPTHTREHMTMMSKKVPYETKLAALTKANQILCKMIEENGGTWWESPGFSNRVHSEQTKRKISEAARINSKGKRNSQYGTMWVTNGIESKKISRESSIPDNWAKGRKMRKVS